jgi:hypothetical protein
MTYIQPQGIEHIQIQQGEEEHVTWNMFNIKKLSTEQDTKSGMCTNQKTFQYPKSVQLQINTLPCSENDQTLDKS